MTQVIFHFVEAVFLAVGPGHVRTASLVAERQPVRQLRHSLSFVQIHGLDGLRIWPSFEQPRPDDPGRRLNLKVGTTERACDDDRIDAEPVPRPLHRLAPGKHGGHQVQQRPAEVVVGDHEIRSSRRRW